MSYSQITSEERYTLGVLRKQGYSNAQMARALDRHRSTIGREFCRNSTHPDGAYRPQRAQEASNGRRSRSRRKSPFVAEDWFIIEDLIRADLSPEQISGRLALEGVLAISHETIYKHIWTDQLNCGQLYRHLRQRLKYRKRYGKYERRGRLPGKRPISERPASVELRTEFGHWEMDTVSGAGSTHCVVTLVERFTGFVLIGLLPDHTKAALNRRVIPMIKRFRHLFKTITVDNGTEFHGYEEIERATGVTVYFATPYHSWERGTNENTNGLIRQYLPKGASMKNLTQSRCNQIAAILNHRPRKRLGFLTPTERLQDLALL
jgi:transposase, IS30 family